MVNWTEIDRDVALLVCHDGAFFMAESIDQFFDHSGPLPVSLEDVRRFPRFYFRSCADAAIYPLGRNQPPVKCVVLTCDLSRSGISVLHNALLYPGQRIDIVLNSPPARRLEVTWCRRLEKGRYLVGCKFKKMASGDE